MMPGHNGGANWGSSAVDPQNGRLYRRLEGAADDGESARAATAGARRRPGPGRRTAGGGPAGGGNRPPPLPPPNAGPDFIPYTAPVDFMIQPSTGLSAIGPPWSQLTAYDLNKGTILWQIPNGDVGEPRVARHHGHGQPRAARRRRGHGRRAAVRRHVVRPHVPRLRRRHGRGAVELRSAGRAPKACRPSTRSAASSTSRSRSAATGSSAKSLKQPEPGPGQYMVFALGSSNQ